ncbi:hypothetical protein V6C03_14010 [Methyloligella sp. 2.7D]|uniref:PepSY domain-containing protein n=1 Tax=unclassified Methyloligella TaxID=2625955 RepID=UPI00157C8F5C|nr:hypothetical protein [Methyloligella sp. GL2]QKP77127.1 hypothetical protein HT051_06455 [Methyloligella sp. GL2]
MRQFRAFIIAPLLVGALTVFWAGSAIAGSDCLPWNAAGPVIAKNGLVPANKIYNQVQARSRGEIIKARLCRQGNRFIYKFTVLGPQGDVQTITVDARTGR